MSSEESSGFWSHPEFHGLAEHLARQTKGELGCCVLLSRGELAFVPDTDPITQICPLLLLQASSISGSQER